MGINTFRLLAVTAAFIVASPTYADNTKQNSKQNTRQYEVTITNLTRGQTFTPQLVTTHKRSVRLFQGGEPASLGLEILAEDGDTTMLSQELAAQGGVVGAIETIPGLLGPGQSASITISSSRQHRFLSVAAMLIPTNDAFMSVMRMRLPNRGSVSRIARAYDAGTELNDQNCLNIPGPRCGGEGHSPGPNVGDEGYVHIGNGFHQLPPAVDGEVLGPLVYDWRNPVARVVVRRIY